MQRLVILCIMRKWMELIQSLSVICMIVVSVSRLWTVIYELQKQVRDVVLQIHELVENIFSGEITIDLHIHE